MAVQKWDTGHRDALIYLPFLVGGGCVAICES